ncbi:AarF/ABC1/UbiB kinase family protein [Leptolyngbya cf. ectocarpi LEGE 11479]|uniref:AarF/ABC1/UbiB kinase family protein n=1 Tax=Leptolyngbya cf. ectocarpi LEGE 11479 TaxID=1828722 RepID=A0A929F7H9_LEPEC|nr:AarF/ABC1/UbiB kinase family protein [Leptolyngbya ectocarpi]MBE9068256.1 AarF/ABC1/UbiB kinase family protein [Leptolyngbya cf. ectocarpi LEGE 11479]
MAELEKMRRYDAVAISNYYRFRLWTVLWRALSVAFMLGSFTLGLLLDRALGRKAINEAKRAAQLRKILTALGPTFIKVGQALSTRPDLVNPQFLDELIKLQDQLPPFDNYVANRIIEKELGRTPEEVYSYISTDPVAAASLGQVYKARLYTGEEVAVKVQRPGLVPIICRDLYLMRWAAGWIAPWLPLNLGHDLTLIVDEFGSKLFEEIDYLNEGRNAEAFAANFADEPKVKVPSIYWRYTSTRVLTLEWIDGIKLTDIERVKAAGLDSDSLVSIGVSSGLRQLLEFGFFHADPHPGNLFAMADGSMAYIDFGMMDQLGQSMKETLVDSVVHLINQEYDKLADDFVRLGFLTPDVDIRPIVPALQSVFDGAIGASVGDFNFKSITDKFSEVMYEYPFRVPAKFALIIRSLVTQEGLALTLNPEFKIVEIAYPYVARRLLMGETESLRARLIEVLFKEGRFQWQRLENMIRIAQGDQGFNLIPTAGLGMQFLVSDEGQYLRQQILAALTEDNRLHTEEVGRLWDLVKRDLQPDQIFGAAWTAFADFSRTQAAALVPAELTAVLSGSER